MPPSGAAIDQTRTCPIIPALKTDRGRTSRLCSDPKGHHRYCMPLMYAVWIIPGGSKVWIMEAQVGGRWEVGTG